MKFWCTVEIFSIIGDLVEIKIDSFNPQKPATYEWLEVESEMLAPHGRYTETIQHQKESVSPQSSVTEVCSTEGAPSDGEMKSELSAGSVGTQSNNSTSRPI